jgi:DnaJ-class molecular chaperone
MDPYQILGVARNASEQDIKRAFRQLSLQYHPDRNPSEEAKTKIVEVNNAYEILSDAEKRKQYDMTGQVGDGGPNMAGEGMNRTQSFHFEFGPGRPGAPMFFHMGGPGKEVHVNHIFEQFFGGHTQGGNPFQQFFHKFTSQRKPEPIRHIVSLTLDQMFTGVGIEIEWDRKVTVFDPPNAMGDQQFIHEEKMEKVKRHFVIPPGLNDQDVIEIPGEGHIWKPFPSANMEIPEVVCGDFQIKLQIIPHAHYQRNGMDMVYRKSLSLCDALCGAEFTLPSIGDRPVANCRIEDVVIQPGFKKVFPGFGFKREGHEVGNLILEFEIEFPSVLSPEQREILKRGFA